MGEESPSTPTAHRAMVHLSRALVPALLLAAPVLSGCLGDSDSTLLLDPHAVEVVSGDGQTAAPGAELPQAVVVRVVDDGGQPLAGLEVTWTARDGGSASPTLAVTDEDGLTSTRWRLGDLPGDQTLTVAVTRTPQVSALITARAVEAGT